MGPPRTALVHRLDEHRSLIAKWLAGIAIDANRLIGDREQRRQLLTAISQYAKDSGASWYAQIAQRDYQRMAKGVSASEIESGMLQNIRQIGQLLKLSPIEAEVLSFAVTLRCDAEFAEIVEMLNLRTLYQFFGSMKAMLGCSLNEVRQTCSVSGTLSQMQLVTNSTDAYSLFERLRIHDGLAEVLGGPPTSLSEILAVMYDESPQPTLTRKDFAHMALDVDLMFSYLAGALRHRMQGCNVLLAGLPGCGKTELARLAAAELKCVAAEVKSVDRSGEPATAQERIASFSLAQAFLSSSDKHILVFDEVEDVFGVDAGFRTFRPFGKRWLNSALETNTTPTIWIANTLDGVDAAHLRRFDIAIRFNTLPSQAREAVINRHLGNISLSEGQHRTLLKREMLLPSQVSMAAKVAQMIGDHEKSGDIVMQVIDGTMGLLHQAVCIARHEDFDVKLVNVTPNPTKVVEYIRVSRYARICIVGPPGSGKTAFVNFLAQELGVGLLVVGTSELIPYNTNSISRVDLAFEQAKFEKRLLLFDEAGPLLLRDANMDTASQASFVNELCTRINEFDGIVCFVTNREEPLNSDFMRQFDFKLCFGFATVDQRRLLFNRSLPGSSLNEHNHKRLEALTKLTVGDFSAIVRRQRIVGHVWAVEEWLNALEEAQATKTALRSPIGFNTQ